MDKKKKFIILINNGSDNITIKNIMRNKVQYPPFGLLNLYSFLTIHGYRVEIIDIYSNAMSKIEFLRILTSFNETPLAIGVSTYTENFFLTESLITLIKEVFPKTKIIMGGPHVSFLPEEAFKIGVDFVVLFEGESSLIVLLEYIKYPFGVKIENIKGIAYNKDGKMIVNPRRENILNLDYIPLTAKYYNLIRNESNAVCFLTSHGCPGKCIFCASAAFSGNKFRVHSAEWIISFIFLFYYRYSYTRIDFIDDNFIVNRKRLKKLFTLLKIIGLNIAWDARCRIDQLEESFISYLSENGCKSLHLGVESADQIVLNSINKNISIDSFFKYFRLLIDGGIRPRCSFIIGHHSDTLETIEKTLLLAYKIESSNLGDVAIGIATPFPGTFLCDHASELGIQISTKNWRNYTLTKPIFSTDKFSLDDLRKVYYLYFNEKKRFDKDGILTTVNHNDFRKKLETLINN